MRSRHILHTGHSIQNQITLGDDHLGFSSFLDMLIHTIKELFMQNYNSVPQTVLDIWLTYFLDRLRGQFYKYDVKCLLNVFKTISRGETYII